VAWNIFLYPHCLRSNRFQNPVLLLRTILLAGGYCCGSGVLTGLDDLPSVAVADLQTFWGLATLLQQHRTEFFFAAIWLL
jgi:hypothetical protein